MLEKKETDHLISWLSDGRGFIVSDADKLADEVLPKFFNHGNFASFVRQLHFYGFHKTSLPTGKCEFQHENFLRGRKDLLHLISRKSTDTITKQRSQIDDLQKQVAFLRQQNERLLYEQNRMMSLMRAAGPMPHPHFQPQVSPQQPRVQQNNQQNKGPFTGEPVVPEIAIAYATEISDMGNPTGTGAGTPAASQSAFTPNFEWGGANAMPQMAPSPRRPLGNANGMPMQVQIPSRHQPYANPMMMRHIALSPRVYKQNMPTPAFSPALPDPRQNTSLDWGIAMQQLYDKGGARA